MFRDVPECSILSTALSLELQVPQCKENCKVMQYPVWQYNLYSHILIRVKRILSLLREFVAVNFH